MKTVCPSIDELSADECSQWLLEVIRKRGKKALFVGAFISRAAPSCIPLAEDIKSAFLQNLISRMDSSPLLSSVEALVKTSDFQSRFTSVPLEQLLSDADDFMRLEPARLLGFMASAAPNVNHMVLARIIEREAVPIVTTNFDELIEQCCAESFHGFISKPHGTVSKPKSLVAQIRRVGLKLIEKETAEYLRALLSDATVIFIGYSGRDIDLRPILNSIPFQRMIWVVRPRKVDETRSELESNHSNLACFASENYPSSFVSVDADLLLARLGDKLGIGGPSAHGFCGRTWRTEFSAEVERADQHSVPLCLSKIFIACGHSEMALSLLSDSMKGADIEKRAQSSLLNAEAHYRSGSYYHAKRYLRVALKLCRGDALKRAQSYNMLGLIASRSSSAQERKWTKRYFDLAEDAMRGSLAERDLITRSNIRLNRAIVFKNEGQFDRARRELDSASRDAKQAGGIAEITRIEEVRGMLWCWQVKRALERNDKKYMALAFLKGKKNFVKALSLAEDLGDTVSVARILNNLCLLHLEMPTTKALLRYAHEANDRAVALSMERGDSHELAKRLAMKGYVFQKANDWDSALSFYREALPNLVDVLPRGACLRDMAVCSFQLGNASAARKLIRESSKILPSGPELEQTMKVLSEIDQAPLIKT